MTWHLALSVAVVGLALILFIVGMELDSRRWRDHELGRRQRYRRPRP